MSAAALCSPLPAAGQSLFPGPCASVSWLPVCSLASVVAPRPSTGPEPQPTMQASPVGGPGPGASFLSSAVLPGLGQHRLGTRRWIAYAGLEVIAGFLYVDSRRDARDLRGRYRDFAWESARLGVSAGPRSDGTFEYYETMSKWMRSGAFDSSPDPGIQPEMDPNTYNGSVWTLAVQIFDLDPSAPGQSAGYDRAVDYYRERGYGASYLWAWSGSDDQSRFTTLIGRSDQRFRDARQAVGLLIANHVLSAVDGFVTARLRVIPGTSTTAVSVSLGAF